MAQPQPQPSLPAYYSELNRVIQNQDIEKAQKISNKILNDYPGEVSAFQCKIVCMIQRNKFDDALKVIHKQSSMASGLDFERAYCEYRLNRTKDALSTLRAVKNADNKCKELLAQVLYRLEEYKECHELLKDLIKNSDDDFDEERTTNLSAVLASLQMWDGENIKDPGLSEDTYELCYNNACYLVGKELYDEAEQKLRTAETLCIESLKEDTDMTEEDINEEVAIIRVQLAYVLQKRGQAEEALNIYNQVLKNRPSDIGLIAVASNNIVTLNKDQNVFDSKKKIKAATSSGLSQKLTSQQSKIVSMNQCLLQMYTNQAEQCRLTINALKKGDSKFEKPVLVDAALAVREKQGPQAIDILQDYLKLHDSETVGLTLAQLYLSQGSVYQACDALMSMEDIRHTPGIVSTLLTLYMSQEDREAASGILMEAVDWHKKNMPESPELTVIMRANANFQVKHGDPRIAAQMLEELRKAHPKEMRYLAQLIAAYSHFDPKMSQQISRDLPSVEEVAKGVDVDALESAFGTIGPKYLRKAQKAELPSPAAASTLLQKKSKKKKKKGKLPQNYDSSMTPDTERWLPRRERSYYRGKRKDKRKDIGKGPQGSTAPAGEFDASLTSPRPSATSGNPTSPVASPGVSAAVGPRQQKPQSKTKKKKKGGKW